MAPASPGIVMIDEVTSGQVLAEVPGDLFAGEHHGSQVDWLVLPLQHHARLPVEDCVRKVVADGKDGGHSHPAHGDRHLPDASIQRSGHGSERDRVQCPHCPAGRLMMYALAEVNLSSND